MEISGVVSHSAESSNTALDSNICSLADGRGLAELS